MSEYLEVSRRELAIGLTIIVLGVLMSAIDSTIVILALPVIMKDLNVNKFAMVRVI